MEDDEKIHCGLCKPKVVKDISQRLVQMSAAKYITNQVFSSALQELKSIQDGYRVIVESGSNFDGEDHKMSLMKRVGDVLKRCHRPEVPTGCHDDRDVVGNIVGKADKVFKYNFNHTNFILKIARTFKRIFY